MNADVPRPSPIDVLSRYGIKFRRRGNEIRTRMCPVDGERSTDCVCINAETGQWIDHAHGCTGDVYTMIAGFEGRDVRTEFPRVDQIAREIVGGVAAPRRMATLPAPRVDYAAVWNGLDLRSCGGERYEIGRGLEPAKLRSVGDLRRYDVESSVCCRLIDLETGIDAGIQRRRIDGRDPKVKSDTGSRVAGSYLGLRAPAIDRNGVDVAVIVEGLMDTLAAHLAFPGCAICGAPGAGQIPRIVAHVAPLVAAAGGWVVLVPHDDDAGVEACAAGLLIAREHGLDDHRGVHLVSTRHADLADAWRAGWRWRWPAEMTGDADGGAS